MRRAMRMSKVTEKVAALAEPIVKENGCRLWDVEFVREAGTWFLRVYIDRDGGVSIDDCERISRALDPILDREDPIPQSYTFEVSSAGCERRLRRPSDFEQFIGAPVKLSFYEPQEGSRSLLGVLEGYEDGTVRVRVGNDVKEFTEKQLAQVNLHEEI